tara:strand:- start:329 stop:4021 length:3693 start_codon:yes stop_codon:yes gene_type:complete
MGDMRRATAAQSRRKVRRSQGLFYGLNVDDDPRSVGDAGSNGIRYNTVLENLVPAGNKLVSRRAQVRGTSDGVSQTLQPKLLSTIESWDGSVLSAYIDEGALGSIRVTSQTDTGDTGTEVVTIGYNYDAAFKAEFYKISSDKILLATNSVAVGFVLIFDNDGAYDSVRIDGGQDATATIGAASSLPLNTFGSYRYDIAVAFSKKDDNGVVVSQTPLVGKFELRMDEKLGTAGYDLYLDVSYNPAYYLDYTDIQIWRTLNFSSNTGDDNDNAAAGGGNLYYKLVDVAIADISTTDIFPLSDTDIIGAEQKILGFTKMPASNICSVSESFFLAAKEERITYTEMGATGIDIGFHYTAFQYYDFDDNVNSLTLSNGWVLVGTTPKTFRWDLITVRDAGVIGESATVGVSIPVMGTPLQASGDIGISADRSNASVVATNGYICAFCADGSVRMFDGATWSSDYTEGKIRSLTINNAITSNAIAGWLPTGEYILWLYNVTLSLRTPEGQTPHRWTIYSDTNAVVLDRDWVKPLVKPIYLGGGNTYNQVSPVENRPCLVIANEDVPGTESRLIWDNTYPFPPTTANCKVQLGEVSGEQWYYFLTPEESHIYINNISALYGDFAISSSLVSRNDVTNPVDITDVVSDAGQITLYPPVDANTNWHSYSILFEITGGDIVINKFDTIAESMDKNDFPTKAAYQPTEVVQEFRTPTMQILTGDGPLMTAGKDPTDATFGLLQGQGGAVVTNPALDASTAYTIIQDSPFGDTYKSLGVVGVNLYSIYSFIGNGIDSKLRKTSLSNTITNFFGLSMGFKVGQVATTSMIAGVGDENVTYNTGRYSGLVSIVDGGKLQVWGNLGDPVWGNNTACKTDNIVVSVGTSYRVQVFTDSINNRIFHIYINGLLVPSSRVIGSVASIANLPENNRLSVAYRQYTSEIISDVEVWDTYWSTDSDFALPASIAAYAEEPNALEDNRPSYTGKELYTQVAPDALIGDWLGVVDQGTELIDGDLGGESFLGYKSGNPLARPRSQNSMRGLFIPSGSALDGKVLVFGKESGPNPKQEFNTISAFWQRREVGGQSPVINNILNIGTGYSIKMGPNTTNKNIFTIGNSGATLTDDYGSDLESIWTYYIITSERVDNGDGTFDDSFVLYRGAANNATLALVDSVSNVGVANTDGVFYFDSNSINFEGVIHNSYWDYSFYAQSDDMTAAELWSTKYNTDNASWVYNAGNNPNTDKGN